MKKFLIVLVKILCCILVTLGFVALFAALWYIRVYGDIGFDSILYTLLNDVGGVQSGLVTGYLLEGFLPAAACSVIACLLLMLSPRFSLKIKKVRLWPFPMWIYAPISLILCASLLLSAASQVKLDEYISYLSKQSTLYQDNYVDPKTVDISFPEQKRNLIYIMLESMETTFLSKELGGGVDENLIPELYELAGNNVNFSHNDGVGGFYELAGAGWTIASMVSQTSGVPLKTPPGLTSATYGEEDEFLPGLTAIGDILDEEGYYQALMVGSEASFGGRKSYYSQHGFNKIYDLYDAREEKIVDEDYFVWWGMEDSYLYGYAKQLITRLSKRDRPFAVSMLTVDTHHVDGYKCDLCVWEHNEQYKNVISCASRQLYAFIEWIKQQDFYENTTIVIVGDHPSMDSGFFERNVDDSYQRTVYNCFINSLATPINTKNRTFGAIDLFPTTLAAMGCKIEGDRLGLGTNVFSDKPTLAEEMGLDEFNAELKKKSDFYTKNFYFK